MFSIFAALVTLSGLVNAQGYVSLPFTTESLDENFSTNTLLHRREVYGSLEEHANRTIVSFTLGDQELKGILDMSSSEIWVLGFQTPARVTYDAGGSEFINNDFETSDFDGNKVKGSYYKDKLTIGGGTVDAQFGVARIIGGNSEFGLFGIGPPSSKDGCLDVKATYTSYPFALKNAGHIETAAYSLVLQKSYFDSSHILFGAVDTSQYTGKLQLLDNQADSSFAVEFGVDNRKLVGELNAGSAYTFLPDDIVSRLAASAGAYWDDSTKTYLVREFPDELSLLFDFSGTEVTVPDFDLVQPLNQSPWGLHLTVKPISQSNGKIILGHPFLKAAYTVYDLEHDQVAIAQAAHSDGPKYQPITSAGIPGASY